MLLPIIPIAHSPSTTMPMVHATPRVAVQSRWTFVHFAREARGPRCHSAPPEVQVACGVAAAKRRERRARTRQAAIRIERWVALAQKLSALHRHHAVAALGRMQLCRITLPATVFKGLEQCMLEAAASAALKWMGAVREVGNAVEIWSTNVAAREHPMKCLIHHAARCKRAWENGCYQVMADGEVPLVLACNGKTTVRDLALMVSIHFGISLDRFVLTHLGRPMTHAGRRLSQLGVGAGSCVMVFRKH